MFNACLKTLTLKNGVYKIIKCKDIDKPIAPNNQIFVHGGILTNDWFSDKLKLNIFLLKLASQNNNKQIPVKCVKHFNCN